MTLDMEGNISMENHRQDISEERAMALRDIVDRNSERITRLETIADGHKDILEEINGKLDQDLLEHQKIFVLVSKYKGFIGGITLVISGIISVFAFVFSTFGDWIHQHWK